MIISSGMVKILTEQDCLPIQSGNCLCNQGYQFQIVLDKKERRAHQVCVESDLSEYITIYRVYDMKGNYEHPLNKKTDDYYIKSENDRYPDLLKKATEVTSSQQEQCVLFVDISEQDNIVLVYSQYWNQVKKMAEDIVPVPIGKNGKPIKIRTFTQWFDFRAAMFKYYSSVKHRVEKAEKEAADKA